MLVIQICKVLYLLQYAEYHVNYSMRKCKFVIHHKINLNGLSCFSSGFHGQSLVDCMIAILHVLINHAIAVGFAPLVTLLEYRGYRAGKLKSDTQQNWDKLAYKLLFVAFIITTSVGAMTGVGIWFSAALVNPGSIGSFNSGFLFRMVL